MNPEYKELLGIINLSTGMNQENAEHMIRALVAKGWTITKVENLADTEPPLPVDSFDSEYDL